MKNILHTSDILQFSFAISLDVFDFFQELKLQRDGAKDFVRPSKLCVVCLFIFYIYSLFNVNYQKVKNSAT